MITRRREQNINEQRGNYQIQQNNLVPKKQILIPIVEEKADFKNNISLLKKDQVARLKDEHPGYIRLQDIMSAPNIDTFEPDTDDFEFMKTLFPKEFKSIAMNDPAVFNLNVCRDFIKVVDYIEQTRDFAFKNLHLVNSKMNADALQKLVEYWRAKTARIKYPLMRKNWNQNLKKEEFGKLEQLRVAFRDREPEKKKLTRQSRKVTTAELCNQLKQIQETTKIVEKMVALTLRREMLKLAQLKLNFGMTDNLQSLKDELLKGTELDIEEAENLYQEYNPEPSPESSIKLAPEPVVHEVIPVSKPIKPPENEIAYFVSTLLCELQKFDFDINEIRMDNLAQINNKIRALKQTQNQQSQIGIQEKVITLGLRMIKPQSPSFENHIPYKRISYSCPRDIYIEKVDQEQFKKDKEDVYGKNIVPDYLIKRNLSSFYQDYSLFQVNATSGFNPDVYCESGSYSTSNISFENYKNRRNIKLFEDLNSFEESYHADPDLEQEANQTSILQKAESDISDLKLGTGFKNWLNNKRVKTS